MNNLSSYNSSEFNYTQWESQEIFERRFLEKLDDEQVNILHLKFKLIVSICIQYKTLVVCLNRLVKNPMAYTMKEYINSFRTKLADTISKQQIEPVRRKTKKSDQCRVQRNYLIYFSYVTMWMVDLIKQLVVSRIEQKTNDEKSVDDDEALKNISLRSF